MTIRTDIPGFQSNVRGVRVFPGGGWSTDRFGTLPILGAKDRSTCLATRRSRPTSIALCVENSRIDVRLSQTNGQPVPTTIRDDTIEADLNLRRGITRIDMIAAEPNSAALADWSDQGDSRVRPVTSARR